MNEALESIISKIIEDKTFTADAVEGIKALRDELVDARDTIEILAANNTLMEDRLRRMEDSEATLQTKLRKEIENRKANEALVSAARNMKEDRAVAEARSDVWREAMQIVFKPTVLRESIQSGHTTNQSGFYVTDTSNQTRTTEKE